jgi:hypothetical protein
MYGVSLGDNGKNTVVHAFVPEGTVALPRCESLLRKAQPYLVRPSASHILMDRVA